METDIEIKEETPLDIEDMSLAEGFEFEFLGDDSNADDVKFEYIDFDGIDNADDDDTPTESATAVKSKITTNRKQYERLVSLMSERSDIAQGFHKTSKENVQSFWVEASEQLNSLGPPTKDITSWKKVWLDYKCYVKRKLTINKAKANRATGGGKNKMRTFNNLEETVIRLTGLVTSTSGIKGTTSFGLGSSKIIISDKSKPTTNRHQYERLVSLMSERSDIAQGLPKTPKENVQSFWEEVSMQLNSLGPPTKDVTSWKKVWLDYKSYVKRKLTTNKAEGRATGGGRDKIQTFNDLEETVIKLTGLETSTSCIKETTNLRSSKNVPKKGVLEVSVDEEEIDDVSMRSQPDQPNVSRSSTTLKTKKSLLQEQIRLQMQYSENAIAFQEYQKKKSEEIATSLRRISRAQEDMFELEKEKLCEMRRHNLEKEQLLKQNLELKIKISKLEEPKFERNSKKHKQNNFNEA